MDAKFAGAVMAVEQAGQVGRKRKKIWLIRQNGERSMNQAVSSCRHSRFESECDSNAFRYRLLLLTQVLTATMGLDTLFGFLLVLRLLVFHSGWFKGQPN